MNDIFQKRREKVRKTFTSQKIDFFFVTNPINVRYLSGFTGGASTLLLGNDADFIFSDARFTIQIEEESPDLEAVIRPGGVTMCDAIAGFLAKRYEKSLFLKLGIEADSISLGERNRLASAVPRFELVPTTSIVERIRMIKDKSEIDKIRRAIDIAYSAYCTVIPDFDARRQSEIDLRNDLEYVMRLCGADEKSFPSIIAAGPRAALPHANPTNEQIGKVSHLLIDWGCMVDGYVSDLTRVIIFDSKNKKLQKVYNTVLAAQNAAIAAVKPGKRCKDIDAIARNVITEEGFGKNFNHGLGHSFGLEVHENPRLAIGSETELKPGMVLTVEPGIYLKNWGGVRIEDDILVTEKGCEVLSKHVPK